MALRRAGWGAALLGALALYLFDNGGGSRALLLSLLLVPLLTALPLLLVKGNAVTVSAALPETLSRCEAGRGSLLLENHGPLSLRLEGELAITDPFTGEEIPLPLARTLPKGGKVQVSLALRADHCGLPTLTVRSLCCVDPFGLFRRPLALQGSWAATVPPTLHPVEAVLAQDAGYLLDSETYSTQRPGSDPSETFRIRPYQPGDPVRQIHWKLSEKTGETLIRELGLPIVNDMLLLLELSPTPEPHAADGLLDLLFSLAQALLDQGVTPTVGWLGEGGYTAREVTSPQDLPALAQELLSTPLRREGRAVDAFLEDPLPYAHVAVLAPQVPPELEGLCRGNRVTVLLPAGEGEPLGDPWETGAQVVPFTMEELEAGKLELEL